MFTALDSLDQRMVHTPGGTERSRMAQEFLMLLRTVHNLKHKNCLFLQPSI